ncbi:uncharacterized protein RJT20DRAFT_38355 [Scheffersomyces xylosifermentans]|uniref:uncharacterized protein n=1 Tax=Scheffersomyces xylosifermentans TaxID=1304137 RepID=UPI00315CC888
MPPQKVVSPVTASLQASGTSIVHGCPGVPRSLPRIETVIEIRSATGAPCKVRSVGIELRTIQKVTLPSKLGSTDSFREYKIYENPLAYRPPVGEFHQDLIALDIPVLIPLPRDIIASGYHHNIQGNWKASTIHKLFVRVACGDAVENEINYIEAFPVAIKLYDTLPLYRQYNEPVLETHNTNDSQVVVELSMPVSSLGPRDELILFTKVMTNHLNNRVKKNLRLLKLTLQIKEMLECHEGGLPKKVVKIYTTSKEFKPEENALNTQGISHQFRVEYPVDNDYLQMYSNKLSDHNNDIVNHQPQGSKEGEVTSRIESYNLAREKSIEKLDEGIPMTHIQGFTSIGKYFSIRYEVVLKVKLVNAKDMEIHLPITVCPFDRISSNYLLRWIMTECDYARHRFGKEFIDMMVQTIHYKKTVDLMASFNPPPLVYRNVKLDLARLGYSAEGYGNSKKISGFAQFID